MSSNYVHDVKEALKARFSIVPGAVIADANLKISELRVLIYLGSINRGWVQPLQETIAEALGLSAFTVSHAIKALVDRGYVEKRARIKQGMKIGNEYRVNLNHDPDPPEESTPPADRTLAASDLRERASREVAQTRNSDIESTRIPQKDTPIVPSGAGKGKEGNSEFEEAWKAWPKHRRVDKAKALKLWRDAEKRGDDVSGAVKAYLASPEAKRADRDGMAYAYVPCIARWLTKYLDAWLERASTSSRPAHLRAMEDREEAEFQARTRARLGLDS